MPIGSYKCGMGSSLTDAAGSSLDAAAGPWDAEADERTALAAAATVDERPLPGLRAWFIIYLVWMSGLAAVALLTFGRHDPGPGGALGVGLLALMCFYLSLCNVFVPLPTAWIILFAASPELGLLESDWQRVVVVAVLGATATAVANLNEYHVLAFLLRYGLDRRIRATRVYRWAIRWFDVAPFHTLLLIGFVPIPIDAIRWLAILRRYSRVMFAWAYFIGRGLRYLLLAWFAVLAQLSAWQIMVVQVLIVVVALATRLIPRPRASQRRA